MKIIEEAEVVAEEALKIGYSGSFTGATLNSTGNTCDAAACKRDCGAKWPNDLVMCRSLCDRDCTWRPD